MSVKNFKFVSPGVFINEIDNSFIPKTADVIGPVVIGRSAYGQGLRPVKVDSFSEFIENFGYPVAGGAGDDVYRDGNLVGPTYGPFAAQGYLRSNVGPVTFIRLLGVEHDDKESDAGEAGWKLADASTVLADTAGAYGLLVIPSGSTSTVLSGTLAAVWYLATGNHIVLSGSIRGHNTGSASTFTGSSAWFHSDTDGLDTDNNSFTVVVQDDSLNQVHKTKFNFNDNSEKFVRKRFNTNPQLTNTTITTAENQEKYWLGETYENSLRKLGLSGSMLGAIVALESGSSGYHTNEQSYQNATAGWFIGQDLATDTGTYNPANNSRAPKLFRLHGLENGEWLHKNVKVSIERIKKSTSKNDTFGSFSVVLRNIRDNDNAVKILERFDNCNLDPASPSYVARKIGDQYYSWNEGERRLRIQGDYRNLSKHVRVEVAGAVAEGTVDPLYLPFGYFGPPKPRDFLLLSGSATSHAVGFPAYDASGSFPSNYLELPGAPQGTGYNFTTGKNSIAGHLNIAAGHQLDVTTTKRYEGTPASHVVNPFNLPITASISFPAPLLRVSASDGTMGSVRKAYFGFQATRGRFSTTYDDSVPDMLRSLPAGLTTSATGIQYSHIFTLDDIVRKSNGAEYASGSRVAGTSCTAVSGTYEGILNAGFNRFTAPFAGGFDGFDITEAEPLRNSGWSTTSTQTNNYAFNTIKRAIDTIADPEFVEMNIATIPGLTNAQLTTHLVNICEDRGDALAVIDIENVYTADTEGTESITERKGTVAQAVTTLRSRDVDSSYGCTFYPWVQIKDETTGRILWVPPSVPMLGVFASSEAKSELWFAPAGFNRGGMSQGAAGLPVLSVSDRLTSKDRDKLYEANINPIASFPSNGIVVFGQKTLQESQSALDRINVRRLTIYLKKQISRLATRVLFDQNVESTWNRFKALVEPFLANTKARFGISEYRLVLDESTTTPDLIDQNILYAKIMIKPTRAIEFIAIDFVVASTGASFDD